MLDHIDLENELHPEIFYWCVNGSNSILFRGFYFYTVHFCLWYSQMDLAMRLHTTSQSVSCLEKSFYKSSKQMAAKTEDK